MNKVSGVDKILIYKRFRWVDPVAGIETTSTCKGNL